MKSKEIYEKLRKDFAFEKCKDNWDLMEINEYIDDEFKRTNMGLLLSSNEEITKVYSMVFPNKELLQKVLDKGEENILIFTHHPMIWDSEKEGFPFHNISKKILNKLKEKKISIFTMHVPLDRNGPYSTSVSFAKALEIEPSDEFYISHDVFVGTIGKTKFSKVKELKEKVKEIINLEPKLYNYGNGKINNNLVGIIAGGGNDPNAIEELSKKEINILVTGVGKINPSYEPSVKFHEEAKKHKINVITATHQATEKFACIAILDYFKELGLDTEFLDFKSQLNDL